MEVQVGEATSDGFWDQIKKRVTEKREANDPYIRDGKGSGKGGKLSALDRIDNGMTAALQYEPTNIWEGSSGGAAQPVQYANPGPMPVPMAEGGRIRPRGALPVRQVRDGIPAVLAEGEYVIPEDVVRSKGVEFFDKLVAKYHRDGA